MWTTFLIKERGRTSFAAFGEGRSKKRPIPVLNANELLKKTRQCYYTKSHGKNATQKEEIFVLKNLRYHSSFIVIFFIQRSHKWSNNTVNGFSNSIHFCQNLCCWVDYMVQLFWKSRDTDTLTQFVPWDIEGQYFSLQFFDLLIIRAWNQTDLEHIQLD